MRRKGVVLGNVLFSVLLALGVALTGCEKDDDDSDTAVSTVVPVGTTAGTFTSSGGSVGVSISVQDSGGTLISGLASGNFTFQNVTITGSSASAVTISISATTVTTIGAASGGALTGVVDFDSSGSMGWNDPSATGRTAGANAFLNTMDGNDNIAFIHFGAGADNGMSDSAMMQTFTTSTSLLQSSLSMLTASGSTPLWESALDALDLLATQINPGGIIVLLTDGAANSTSNLQNVIAQAISQNAQIFTIGLGSSLDFTDLRTAASQTGGTFAEASDSTALAAAFAGIGAGATTGFVTVSGTVTFTSTISSGTYTITGNVVTTSGGATVSAPFTITVTIP